MARRSQCSSAGDNPLNPNYLPPHYREEYRLAVDALVEEDLEGYYQFLLKADVVDFLSAPEIEFIQGAIRAPQHGDHPEHLEQRFPEGGADGSSDTYWPLHSDLDAPGLDLGWPQTHHFIGPTEITTLVNPPEPDMPSIKEQARRLIKNANQVVAIAMDMFTDVDIFADILGAAMRNVAVYVLLDKENVHHFINMAANCRVDLHAVQYLRVRTVSGITYRCRSGKTFTGQMMDRFLLTDCRAVLSGNYSFMWSYEKLHRCMAHLFLGQLVSTFDEEFRILFAQSEPLVIDNLLPPIEDFSQSQMRKYSSERPLLYREPRKFLSLDTPHPDEWARHPHEDQMDLDWRMAPLKRQEASFGSSEVYGRFGPQQSFDQGAPRMLMMENPAFKRHSYAEGGQGRYSLPYLQPEPENQGRQLHRAQQPYPDYSGYDRFWNQDFDSTDAYCEPGLPPEIERRGSFDPVLNYLSTRNPDLEQAPEKMPPAADPRFSSSQPRRLSLGQPYACQTSPTSSNPSDQKAFLFEPSPDRKDPTVKRGLRNWRISSFLSAYDNPGDDGLPSTPPNAPDAFEEPCDVSVPKIPNVREFRIPALPRASQMPSFTKTAVKEPQKIAPVEPAAEPKLTPSPSESSSTTEGERTEEAEPKETKALQREESFRRKYNPALQRSSRLRSSLIFSSLDQQHPTNPNPGQQDVEGDKNEAEQKKLPFMSQVIGQRKPATREPIEWSRYLKSSTFDGSPLDTPKEDGQDKVDNKDIINYNRGAKADCKDIEGHEKDSKADHKDDKDSGKDKHLREPSENIKAAPVEQVNPSVPVAQPKNPEPKCDPASQAHKPLFMSPVCLDMNDPDQRLMFFKELAAQRRAAKAAEAEPKKPATGPTNVSSVKHDKDPPAEPLEMSAEASQCLSGKDAEKTESSNFVSQHPNQTVQKDQHQKKDLKTDQNSKDQQTRTLIGSEVNELKSQSGQSLPVSAETQTQTPQSGEMQLHPAVSPTAGDPVPDHLPPEALNTKDSQSPHQESTSHHQPGSACSDTIPPSSEQLSQPEGSCSTKQPTSSPAESKPANSGPAESTKPGILSLNVKESPTQSDWSLPGREAPSVSQSQTAVDHVHPISSLVASEIIHDTESLEHPEEVGTEPQQHFEGGLDPCKLIGSSEQVKAEGSEVIGPSEQVKAEGSEVIGLTEQVKAEGSEVIGPTEQVKAEGSEVIGPTEQVKAEGSEVIGPSEHVRAEGSEVIGPSEQIKAEDSEPIGQSGQVVDDTLFVARLKDEQRESSSDPNRITNVSSSSDPPTDFSPSQAPPSEMVTPGTTSTGSGASSPTLDAEQTQTHSDCFTENSPTSSLTSCSVTAPTGEPTAECVHATAPPAGSPVPDHTHSQSEDKGVLEMLDQTDRSNVMMESQETSDQSGSTPDDPAGVTSEEVVPSSPQSKQSKSRYHSSTANVLSSSNLRDDTKLLLEQISVNSQNRNETSKESAVTDDDKEGEANKKAKREIVGGIHSLSRGPPKSSEEREKLLERIQSMRKERKVYSRFEMAP